MAKTTAVPAKKKAPVKRKTVTTSKVTSKKATTVKAATTKKTTAPKKAPLKKAAVKKAIKAPAAEKKVVAIADPIRDAAFLAAHCALEKKATDVQLLDLRKITSMTDYFIICSASSDMQVKAVAENVIVKMRDEYGIAPWKSEGWDTLQWMIVDFVDFVVHIFRESAREYYHLERLWGDAPTEEIKDTPVEKKRKPATKKSK